MDELRQTSSALVLFSGGQDSAVCLLWALGRYDHVETITFDYGQRHKIELECRKNVITALRNKMPERVKNLSDDHIIDLSSFGAISESSLTRERAIEWEKNNLPNSFVPGRNLLFFTYAAALGYRRNIRNLIGGMCETDYSGYPDCRAQTLKALQTAINLGMEYDFEIHTPLMRKDKAATWQMAEELGGVPFLDIIRIETHSCYIGDRSQEHEWGYGCGACPACELRAKGWRKYQAA
jgi:7-cyano-7-deazaguanine synthase